MYKYLLTCTLFIWSFTLFAESLTSSQLFLYQQRDKETPHHIYFGPEFFCYNLNIQVNCIQVDDNKCFLGMRLGYEYLKPNAFYGAVDLLSAGSDQGFGASIQGQNLPKQSGMTGFGNLEVRLGYTTTANRWLLSPFLGMGGYAIGQNHHVGFQQSMAYLVGGVRGQAEVNNHLNIGLNFKIFRTLDTTRKYTINCKTYREDHNMWGGEIGIPFIWWMGSSKRWDAQLEPYFLKLQFSEQQNLYGIRLLFGYHF